MSKKDTKEPNFDFSGCNNHEKREILQFIESWYSYEPNISLNTSGSTGPKKTISVDKRFLKASALMTGTFFSFTKNNKVLHCLPMSFVAGKMMIIRILEFQMSAYFCSPANPLNFPDDVTIDFAAMTPYQYEKAYHENLSKLSRIKTILLGGAGVSFDLEEKIKNVNQNVFHSYGMTETYSHVALRQVGKENQFHALNDIHFSQDDDNSLVIHAENLGIKHLKTNDIVNLLDEKSFLFLGRKDNVVNSGGIKLFPEEIEKKLSNQLKNLNYFLAGVPDPHLGEKLVLFVESDAELIFENWGELNKFEIPKSVYFCEAFCYTDTGKLNRTETVRKVLI